VNVNIVWPILVSLWVSERKWEIFYYLGFYDLRMRKLIQAEIKAAAVPLTNHEELKSSSIQKQKQQSELGHHAKVHQQRVNRDGIPNAKLYSTHVLGEDAGDGEN
jgi:hypothetical protein